jgi:hypothetical protein
MRNTFITLMCYGRAIMADQRLVVLPVYQVGQRGRTDMTSKCAR